MNIIKVIIIAGAIILGGCMVANEQQNPNISLDDYEIINTQGTKDVFPKMSEVTVTANKTTNDVIPLNTSFDLKFDQDVSTEYVMNTFSLKPTTDFEIRQINTKYYQMKATNDLEENQIYNIVEKTTDGTKKWAFQTEKVFQVEYTYPDNNSYLTETGVPEIIFTGEVADINDLNRYVSIEPRVAGTWVKSYTYEYHFEPKANFEMGKTYTFTVLKGLKDVDGNELKEDYSFHFSVNNEEDIYADLYILNTYQPNSLVDISMSLNMNLRKQLSLDDATIKIMNVGSKEKFLTAFQEIEKTENLQKIFEGKQYQTIFTKDISGQIKNAYQEAKAKNRYYYYDDMTIDSNLKIREEGYYIAVLKLNDNISAALFQVNETSATCSVLAGENMMILYKGKNGKNNRVDVYVNHEKLGTTNEEGLLYMEDFRNIVKDIQDEFNYVEFKNGGTELICNISGQVSKEPSEENALTSISRFHNGYLYLDKNYYKVGETVHLWGYLKNRKTNIKTATLEIVANGDDLLREIPLVLTEAGTFETEYVISDVNEESYVSVMLQSEGKTIASRYFNIKNYEMKQYLIDIVPEKTKYLTGDIAKIDITASTYDGTPLGELDFSYEINGQYYYNNKAKEQNGKVTTDENGKAQIVVPLIINAKTNITPETVRVNILNEYIDGEREVKYYTVYPYKNYATGNAKMIVDENKYYLSFEEYQSLNREVVANDSIKVVAKAFKTVREVTGTKYNRYTKEMEEIVNYREEAVSAYDKTFTISMTNGKGSYELANYAKDKNCYYHFYAYLITDTGKELALSYNGQVYAYSYKTINDTITYEEVEYVTPILNNELTYSLQYERNEKLKVGDEVYFYLQDNNGKRLNDYSMFNFYTLVVSADGNKIYTNKGERPHFTFTKEMGANCATYTILFDSLKTYSPSSNARIYYSRYMIDDFYYPSYPEISLCEEELSLNMSISFDKDIYEPKEEAEITIKVTSEGKGVKTGVNLSALDTAYIDANGRVGTDIIRSLYNSYRISSMNSGRRSLAFSKAGGGVTSGANSIATLDAMAEESAEMPMPAATMDSDSTDSSLIRDDLKVTAFFESLVTDDNGEAKIKVKLPDNITEWTITAQAISNDYKAASGEKKIKVSKDFFVSMNHKDRYLVGEHFGFNVKSFSKKYAGQDVSFKVEILDETGKVLEQNTMNAKVSNVLSYQVGNAITKSGTYQIRITGTCGNVKDILVDEIEVTDSLLDATIREERLLKVGDQIAIVSPKGYLYILNKDMAKILPTLFELTSLYHAQRNDTVIISKEANRIFENLVNGVEFDYASKASYDAEKTIFKVMKNSSDDARLALRMLATRTMKLYEGKSSQTVFEKIEVRLGKEAVLWAKAASNMGSLTELKAEKQKVMADSSSYTKESVLYLALAFAEVGSTDDAMELYNIVANTINEKEETEFELKVILAIKLNLKEMENLYQTYIVKDLQPEHLDFVKLYYVQNAVSKNYQKGTLVLKINGKNEEVEIKNVGLTRKLISRKDTIEVASMSDNLSFMVEQYKPVDFDKAPNNPYIISKTYSNSKVKVGDIVKVSITIDNKKMYDDGYEYGYKIEDAIPNNMTFVEYRYGEDTAGYLRKQDGQKLTIGCWNPYDPKYNPTKTKSVLTYEVRVTNGGEQLEPGTIMEKYNNEIIAGYHK